MNRASKEVGAAKRGSLNPAQSELHANDEVKQGVMLISTATALADVACARVITTTLRARASRNVDLKGNYTLASRDT